MRRLKRRSTGQGMVEVCMLLALLALAGVGALTLLGGSTATLLGGAGGSGIAVANTGSGGGAGGPATSPATQPASGGLDLNGDGVAETLSNTDSITPIYGADGTIEGYEVTGYTEDGTQVTSVVGGTEMLMAMAGKMEKLVNDPALKDANGNSLVSDIASFNQALQQLTQATTLREQNSAAIQQLGDMFAAAGPLPDPNATTPQQYPSEMVEGVLAITESYIQMSNMYNNIQSQMDQLAVSNPAQYEQLAADFSQIANAASTVSLQQTMPDVLSGLQMSRVDTADFASMSGKYGNATNMIISTYQTTAATVGNPSGSDVASLTEHYNNFNATFVQQMQGSVATVAFGDTSAIASGIHVSRI